MINHKGIKYNILDFDNKIDKNIKDNLINILYILGEPIDSFLTPYVQSKLIMTKKINKMSLIDNFYVYNLLK